MQGSSWVPRQGRTVYTGTPRSSKNDCCLKVLAAIALVAIPITLFSVERQQYQLQVGLKEIESKVIEVDSKSETTFPTQDGTPVYLVSEYTGSAANNEFGLSIDHALQLQRNTQYCQWQEIATEDCDTCTNDDGSTYRCHCTTTYYYQKGWHNHLIISAFFDQPFNHDNPQRNPYPTTVFSSENTIAGEMYLEPELLLKTRGPSRVIQFLHPGQPKPSYSFWKFFGWKDDQRYESTTVLEPLLHSEAYQEHQFAYTGEEGWFFSPYEASMASSLLKKMGQFLEGSLFDWQLADFMGGCTPGDIRVRFRVVDPSEVTVVGKYSKEPTPRVGIIDNLHDSTARLGFVHAGAHSYAEVVNAESSIASNQTWLLRALTLVFGTICLTYLGALPNWISSGGASLAIIAVSSAVNFGFHLQTILFLIAAGLTFAAGSVKRDPSKAQ